MAQHASTYCPQMMVNVYDPAALHARAYAAYTRSGARREEAEEVLGTAEAPNLTSCLVELWSEFCPAEAGYEFLSWED